MKLALFSLVGLSLLVLSAVPACVDSNSTKPDEQPLDDHVLMEKGVVPYPLERIEIEINQRIEDLRESGSDKRELQSHIADLSKEWQSIAKQIGQEVDLTQWECYENGCSIISRHKSSLPRSQILAEFTHAKTFLQWNAGKFQSAPLANEDGYTHVTWIFFAPENNEPILLQDEHLRNINDSQKKPTNSQAAEKLQ